MRVLRGRARRGRNHIEQRVALRGLRSRLAKGREAVQVQDGTGRGDPLPAVMRLVILERGRATA